jgi:hypothetical protein
MYVLDLASIDSAMDFSVLIASFLVVGAACASRICWLTVRLFR